MELIGVTLERLIDSVLTEFEVARSIFEYPQRKFYTGYSAVDFSVDFHGQKAATPLGPASGPHTQMAQNIVLSFLGGCRIMELKTIQILDQLEIGRPCIDARNVCYNIEWSQELRLDDSFDEYVKAWILLKIIEEEELVGPPKGSPFYNTIFDLSVGYDLKGISSSPVKAWIARMRNAEAAIQEQLEALPARLKKYKNLTIPSEITRSITLSTFHGCPADEIEKIVEHLITEHGVHVIVKMNPTLLGYEEVSRILIEELGYQHIQLDPAAFDHDMHFEEAIEMMKRLKKFAHKYDRKVGAKFTNTLVVKNKKDVFPDDDVAYLSGAPLHVLSMNIMHRFRKALNEEVAISFSAGVDQHNVVDAVLCNMAPVTTCTDLLKKGGYSRLFMYLKRLKEAMAADDCNTIDTFILARAGLTASDDLYQAGLINGERIVPQLVHNPRYHDKSNKKEPPRIDSKLVFFDCISCNICVPVCPNAANFYLVTGKQQFTMICYKYQQDTFVPVEGKDFVLEKKNQYANLAEFCNDCGNCDTFCPEVGAPFIEKPRFFHSAAGYRTSFPLDGFFFPTPFSMTGRLDKKEYHLALHQQRHEIRWQSPEVDFVFDEGGVLLRGTPRVALSEGETIDMEVYYTMKILMDSILKHPDDYPAILIRGTIKEKVG